MRNGQDISMPQAGDSLCLVLELLDFDIAGVFRLVDYLDRDRALQPRVQTLVYPDVFATLYRLLHQKSIKVLAGQQFHTQTLPHYRLPRTDEASFQINSTVQRYRRQFSE